MNSDKSYVDLHIHTVMSDGSDYPDECVEYASKEGLSVIAITDHNTLNGVEDAIDAAEQYGIKVIPAVEADVDYLYHFHFLCYFPDDRFLKLQPYFQDFGSSFLRSSALKIIIEKYPELKILRPARPYDCFAALSAKGYFTSAAEADSAFVSESSADFESGFFTACELFTNVHNCGGLVFLAHPFEYGLDGAEIVAQLEQLKKIGLDGVEAFHFSASTENTKFLIKTANELGLLVSGGSDYHGEHRPSTKIGFAGGNRRIPYQVYELISGEFK